MKATTISLLGLSLALSPLLADSLSLVNGDSLTGDVLEMSKDGKISLESTNTTSPLQIRSSAISSIGFEFTPAEDHREPERVHLRNGDVLPGTIRNLDSESLELRTWACGDVRIPRSAIASVDFGMAPHHLAFRGPLGMKGWKDGDNWKYENQSFRSSTGGSIARADVLPEQFILRFRVEWQTNPNLRLYFCDDYLKRGDDYDRYYFEINSGGLQLKRIASDSKRTYFPLYSASRRPESFPDRAIDVEIRVDRQRRLIYVYIDGESEGRFIDPVTEFPSGSGIMIDSLAGGDMKNIVSNIEIYKWDAISQIHRHEGHKNTKADAIITNESERYEGTVDKLQGSGAERTISIKSPHSDDPVEIPFNALSVLYFRKVDGEEPKSGSFSLHMAGRARLTVARPSLNATSFIVEHPLLGEITIRRDAVSNLNANRQAE